MTIESSLSFYLMNKIVAGSPSGDDCYSDENLVTKISNLIEDGIYNSAHTGDPLLYHLADYGVPSYTMAIGLGSSAINAGDDVTCETIDQRGMTRPHGNHCDIGAFEFHYLSIYLPGVFK